MKLNDESRVRVLIPMTLSADPTGSTVELKVDATWHAATWQGTPVASGGVWKQTARTTGYFAGTLATASGATVLAAGRHPCETRVTWPAGDTVAYPAGSIDAD